MSMRQRLFTKDSVEHPAISNVVANPRTSHYEFGGPCGALALTLGMPAIVLLLNAACSGDGACPSSRWLEDPVAQLQALATSSVQQWRWHSLFGYCVWLAWCAALYRLLPGKRVPGVSLRDGSRLIYKLNAFGTLLFTIVSIAILINFHGLDILVYIADNFMALILSGIVVTYALSVALYVGSFLPGRMLALGGNSGNVIYDFFIGRELNPRIGRFDLKQVCELRPGLIGWLLFDVVFLAKQYVEQSRVSSSLLALVFFQGIYIFDALWHESAVLTTMDITTDGFGYMLVSGDLLWVPFLYSLQAKYLCTLPVESSNLTVLQGLSIVLVNTIGYVIFRGANSQKNAFRALPQDHSVAHLKYIETKTGSRLLISGWWGKARHINYFGDWLMAVAWSLLCGLSFDSAITWFYPVYFGVLLIHRFHRDEHKCKVKYGEDWNQYCRKVPWKIIPYIY